MNKDLTVLMLIVDQSGSMSAIQQESQQALDDLVKAQKEQPGELMIKLVTFNHDVEVRPLIKSEDFAGVTLEPQGMTALHDAVGFGIRSLDADIGKLARDDNMPGKVIVVILTDGEENASREYTPDAVKKVVEAYQSTEKWEFLFLGANQDAVTTASNFGIRAGASMTYQASGIGVTESINATSRYISDTRSGLRTDFTDEERNKSGLTGL